MIVPGLQFQKSSDTFGQWVDSSSQLYGLNFLSAPEAEQVRHRRRSRGTYWPDRSAHSCLSRLQ